MRFAVAGVGGGVGTLCRAFDARQQQKRVRFADCASAVGDVYLGCRIAGRVFVRYFRPVY